MVFACGWVFMEVAHAVWAGSSCSLRVCFLGAVKRLAFRTVVRRFREPCRSTTCFSGTSRDSFPVYLIGCLRPVCLQGVAAGIRFLSLLSLWPDMLCESARWGGCRGQWLLPRFWGSFYVLSFI